MDDQEIRLSVVATSRNDDHGANLHRRMQTFVNAFIKQCKRHDLRAELILVEWNPPADRPRLAQSLRWPADPSPCEVRVIEVPEQLHRRFQHADVLPLFQMIGKNVGIRRARGKFILATNIDVIFNDELMRFLKEGKLETGKIYRIDRTDVETDVPVDSPIEEQLAYCRTHHLRLNASKGTFPLDSLGVRVVWPNDVSAVADRIVPMDGAYHIEHDAEGKVFRWAGEDVELFITAPKDHARRMMVELSPGPCVHRLPAELELLDGGRVVARGKVLGRCVVALTLPLEPGQRKTFILRAVEGNAFPPPEPDYRILNFVFHRLWWSETGPERPPQNPEEAFAIIPPDLAPRDVLSDSGGIHLDLGWRELRQRAGTKWRWADSGASFILDQPVRSGAALRMWVAAGSDDPPGRGTRKARRSRLSLQLRDETDRVLDERPIGFTPRPLALRLPDGTDCCRVFLYVRENGKDVPASRGVAAFRIFSCNWSNAGSGAQLAADAHGMMSLLGFWGQTIVKGLRALIARPPRSACGKNLKSILKGEGVFTPPRLHTNACGDFMLMAREHWFELCGYTELEIFSLHLDTLFLYAVHLAGLEEVVLPGNMRLSYRAQRRVRLDSRGREPSVRAPARQGHSDDHRG